MSLTFCIVWSQFEERFEDIPDVDDPSNVPSTSGVPENQDVAVPIGEDSTIKNMETQEVDDTQRVYSDMESHDFVDGIMKIVPPDLDVSPNFFNLKLFRNSLQTQKATKI